MLRSIKCVPWTVLLTAAPALGCPWCASDVGEEVAAGIFNDDFGLNAVLTLLPIPLLLLIVFVIHFGIPWPDRQSDTTAADNADNTNDETSDVVH